MCASLILSEGGQFWVYVHPWYLWYPNIWQLFCDHPHTQTHIYVRSCTNK